jgi:hypothetical protein
MKCKQVKELMGAYLYGDLEPEDMREVRLHTQECEECRADLESRGHVVSSLIGEAPSLTDDDRARIAHNVKSGIRTRDTQTAVWWLRPASALALAAVVLAGFAIGRHIGTAGSSSRTAVKTYAKKPIKAVVTITEAPPPSTSTEQQSISQDQQNKSPRSNMADYARRMAMPAVTKTDRNNSHDRRKQMVVDEPVQVVAPAEQKKEREVKQKLPKPSGLNDVQTNE